MFQDPGRIRYFESVLELMAERGHQLQVGVERQRERIPGQLSFIRELAERCPKVTFGNTPKREADGWGALGRRLRLTLDYVHYCSPRFDAFPDFRARAARDAPTFGRRLVEFPGASSRPGRVALRWSLGQLEESLPVSRRLTGYVREHAPDVLLVTPLVWFGADQSEWIRAGRSLGVRTGGCIFSWDNLTSKGAIRARPDFLTVWNDAQRREASELHGYPPAQIVPTGAQNWDHWFEWQPSRSRAAFCREVGLPPDRPFLLYLESSGYVEGEENFVGEWIATIRKHGGASLRDAGVLVRPHPQATAARWAEAGVAQWPNVVVWPPGGEVPLDERSRRNFYDCIHHSSAVVGVNTSAFIESAILGRACLALELPRFRKGQLGTVHFHHLLERNGGPLKMAGDFPTHMRQLESVLAGDGQSGEQSRNFVKTFVRPFGLDVPAAPRFVAAVEGAQARPVDRTQASPRWHSVSRKALTPFAERLVPGGQAAKASRR